MKIFNESSKNYIKEKLLKGKVVDERCGTQLLKISSSTYKFSLAFLLISVILKTILCKFSFSLYLTEVTLVIVSILYVSMRKLHLNLPLIGGPKDERTEQIINILHTEAFCICLPFWTIITLVHFFVTKSPLLSIWDVGILLIPGSYSSFKQIKTGALSYGTKKAKKAYLKKKKINILLDSIIFAILFNLINLFPNGKFNPSGIWNCIFCIILLIPLNILGYFISKLFYKISEKRADKYIDKD
ncbi:DUF6773 family protein [Clostridium hydrogenum]|uniref:DUF6773 family protein n=1 Tax=Clostridium hydrogenum TaxID=2855764 RepID=UPI001F392221|nr:DUF6773 family protein [Clostridium hydrogenum]